MNNDHQKTDTHNYQGWLNSDSFVKRALAVYGYNLVGGLIISVPVIIIFIVLAMVFAFRS